MTAEKIKETNYLAMVQNKLKAPKNQKNTFGNYNYRNCEDILEALKPIINPDGWYITITDEIVQIGNRVYVKATASLNNGINTIGYSASAYAREPESRKGMDDSQITGATSSYARKYALNGLFAIDDTKDADATNTHEKETKPMPEQTFDNKPEKVANVPTDKKDVWMSETQFNQAISRINKGEKDVLKKCKDTFGNKMKNVYVQALEKAELNYKDNAEVIDNDLNIFGDDK